MYFFRFLDVGYTMLTRIANSLFRFVSLCNLTCMYFLLLKGVVFGPGSNPKYEI